MTAPRVLMLVSDRADAALRQAVAAGSRPCPEYLHLEETYGVDLLDWSRLPHPRPGRSLRQSLHHVTAALRQRRTVDVFFSDGEHLGVPMALAMAGLRLNTPHLVIGHHLTTPPKRPLMRILGGHRGMTRILLHSRQQVERAHVDLGIPASRLAFVPYYADTNFWRQQDVPEEPLIVSAGREHRDYLTLVRATTGLPARVFIAAGSVFSPGAHSVLPLALPSGCEVGVTNHDGLRRLYARASLVVVPLVENDFQAGVTTLLEAMAMGKAVIVSATSGQRDIVEDGVTGILVPPSDAGEMRRAIRFLLNQPEGRRRLGRNARQAFEARYDLRTYGLTLARHLKEISGAAAVAA